MKASDSERVSQSAHLTMHIEIKAEKSDNNSRDDKDYKLIIGMLLLFQVSN